MKQSITKGMLLLAVILMKILTGMEFDLFVPSFPELQDQFKISPFWVEALLSVNFGGFCISLFIVGYLADAYERKSIILLGLIVFIIGSLLCLWAPSYIILLSGRLLQGIGIAAPAILSFVIVADSYALRQQQYFLAILSGVMNISVGFAPVIGSYITLYFGWQGNFTILLALGVIVLIMATAFVPLQESSIAKEAASLTSYAPIFKSKNLMLMIISFIFSYVPYWIFVGISPLLYIEDLKVSLAHFGYYQGSLAFIFAIGSIIYGLIIDKFNQTKMLYASIFIWVFCLSLMGLAILTDSKNPLFITVAFLPFCIGQIVPSIILYPICINILPQAKARITAIIQAARLILSGISLQIAGYYYTGSFQSIGIIISFFISLSVITLFLVLKNKEIMKFIEQKAP